ncbi:MAG: hypothetical protein AAGM84_12070 [Pseudomonadota bacterium]
MASLKASPARHYVTDAAGTERCNAFLRIEHLAEDIAPLEAHLGFALEVPRANKSDRDADWRCYYDTASADSVAAACAEDIVRFGYRFDGASG